MKSKTILVILWASSFLSAMQQSAPHSEGQKAPKKKLIKYQRDLEKRRESLYKRLQSKRPVRNNVAYERVTERLNLSWQGYDRLLLDCIALNEEKEVQELLEICGVNYVMPWQPWTPLNQAINDKRPAMVKLLIEAGADLITPIGEHGTPLEQALSYKRCGAYHFQGDPEVVEELLKAGVEVSQQEIDRFVQEVVSKVQHEPAKIKVKEVLEVLERYKVG